MIVRGWRGALAATVAEATGRDRRRDPHAPGTGGPAGNARITAWTGLVLLVLFLAELVTVLDVQRWLNWHVALGALLLPPSLLKTGSTGWRILRYYSGNRDYQTAGPPPMPLRVLGPLVVATTLGLLASGIVLIAVGPRASQTNLATVAGYGIDWVTIHQGLFILWAVATGLHVLVRLLPAVNLTVTRPRSGEHVDGRSPRVAVHIITIALSALTAVLLVSASSAWRTGRIDFYDHGRHDNRAATP